MKLSKEKIEEVKKQISRYLVEEMLVFDSNLEPV